MDLMLIYVIFFVGRPSCCCFMGLHWSGKNKESGRNLEPKCIYEFSELKGHVRAFLFYVEGVACFSLW